MVGTGSLKFNHSSFLRISIENKHGFHSSLKGHILLFRFLRGAGHSAAQIQISIYIFIVYFPAAFQHVFLF